MKKTPEEIIDGLSEAELKEVFHLAGKKLGHHSGTVTAQDDSGNGIPGDSGDNVPPPHK